MYKFDGKMERWKDGKKKTIMLEGNLVSG